MTATRGIVASLVVVTLVAVGVFFYVQSSSSCPDAYSAGTGYSTGDQVLFTAQVWETKVDGTSQVPGPNSTDWTVVGTC